MAGPAGAGTATAVTGRGVLVTLRRDGRPQLSNVDYLAEPGLIRCSTTGDRAKVRNLRRDPRASFHVTTADGGAYAVAEGTVTLSPPAGAPDDATVAELVEVYRRIRGEHSDWADYQAAMVADGRLVVRLAVDRVVRLAALTTGAPVPSARRWVPD